MVTQEFEQTFLWIHQTQWQKDMLYSQIASMGIQCSCLMQCTKPHCMILPYFLSLSIQLLGIYIFSTGFFVHSGTNEQIEEAWTPWSRGIHYGHILTLWVTNLKLKYLASKQLFLMPLYTCIIPQGWKLRETGKEPSTWTHWCWSIRAVRPVYDCAWAGPCQENENPQEHYYH